MSSYESQPEFTKHPHFDLMLPSSEMLLRCVGAPVLERNICHEWPLSCVERVVFDGGLEKYCKSTRPPSMELEVYASLSSPILVPYQFIGHHGVCSSFLLDAFPGKRLSRELVEAFGFSAFIDDLRGKLKAVSGEQPVFVDFSTSDNVRNNLSVMGERLHRRFGQRDQRGIDTSLLQLAEKCISSKLIHDAFMQDVTYSNGDLSADNILAFERELRVVDWQFPRVASLNVELVNLYDSLGIDPLLRLTKAEVVAGLLCKVRWLAECADVWLTACDYRSEISALLARIRGIGVFA